MVNFGALQCEQGSRGRGTQHQDELAAAAQAFVLKGRLHNLFPIWNIFVGNIPHISSFSSSSPWPRFVPPSRRIVDLLPRDVMGEQLSTN